MIMENQAIRKSIFLFVALLFVLACELPALTTPAPNTGPLPIETIIAGTAVAAQTQTAILLPPPTLTPTIQTPTETLTETPTSTPTVIFLLPSFTPSFQPSDAGSNCQLVALVPYNPVMAPRTSFDTTWTLKNTGTILWLDQNIDFKFSGGTDMHSTDVVDLPSSVPTDGLVDITVPMVSPSNPGTYTSTWSLTNNKTTLCRVSVRITVK